MNLLSLLHFPRDSGSQFEGSALRLPLSCGMECGSSSDEIDDDQQQQQHQQQPHQIHLQQQQHSQPHQQSANPHQFDSGGEEDERKPAKPYDHVMGWNTTEFLSQSIRANNVLGISDSSIGMGYEMNWGGREGKERKMSRALS